MHDFTTGQIRAISSGVRAGRKAAMTLPVAGPLLFFRALVSGGGLQMPGRAPTERERLQIVALAAGSLLTEGNPDFDDLGEHFGEAVCRTARREVERARWECHMLSAAMADDVLGYRLVPAAHCAGHAVCRALRVQDQGLGPGVLPFHTVVVLPAECDGSVFEAVYRNELAPP